MALRGSSQINSLTSRIIGCAIRVHRAWGPGLLEKPYNSALAVELTSAQLKYACEVPLKPKYEDRILGVGYRIDFVVEETVVVEVKSIQRFLPVHRQQLITYLKLSNYAAGLLINFNVPLLKNGLIRVLNDPKAKAE